MAAVVMYIPNCLSVFSRTGPRMSRCRRYAEETAFSTSLRYVAPRNQTGAVPCKRRMGVATSRYHPQKFLGDTRKAQRSTESGNHSGEAVFSLKRDAYPKAIPYAIPKIRTDRTAVTIGRIAACLFVIFAAEQALLGNLRVASEDLSFKCAAISDRLYGSFETAGAMGTKRHNPRRIGKFSPNADERQISTNAPFCAIIHRVCGRYRLSRRKQILPEHFDATPFNDDWEPRYNIAPSQLVPVIRQKNSTRELSLLRWGLIPSWASDPSIGFKTINARSETITTTASFRDPFRTQRCLIPADGFYEWSRNGKAKQPYCFEVGDAEMFAFAGLWDRWINPQGIHIESCTIITTTPNSHLTDIHNRMPVILPSVAYASWLNPAMRDTHATLGCLVPYAGAMRHYPVSGRINQVQNDDEECARPVELAVPPQGSLFA